MIGHDNSVCFAQPSLNDIHSDLSVVKLEYNPFAVNPGLSDQVKTLELYRYKSSFFMMSDYMNNSSGTDLMKNDDGILHLKIL